MCCWWVPPISPEAPPVRRSPIYPRVPSDARQRNGGWSLAGDPCNVEDSTYIPGHSSSLKTAKIIKRFQSIFCVLKTIYLLRWFTGASMRRTHVHQLQNGGRASPVAVRRAEVRRKWRGCKLAEVLRAFPPLTLSARQKRVLGEHSGVDEK